MKPTYTLGAIAVVAGAALAGAGLSLRPPPDQAETARTLLHECANLREGDLVLITGKPQHQELLEHVAVQARKSGAYPLIVTRTDELDRRFYEATPPKYDAQPDQFRLALAGIPNVHISVESDENPALWADVPPARAAAFAKAEQPIADKFLRRNVRQVILGNGLYPTAATAKLHGLSAGQLETLFWSGVNTDYSKLDNVGEAIRARLTKAHEIRITNPNGTDLKFTVTGRSVYVSDGVITSDDLSRGGPACQVWLPAGEVYSTPVPGTAEGTVVIDRHLFRGQEITGLKLVFKSGRMTEMTAASGLEPLKAVYDASTGAKDVFAFYDVGINQDMRIPENGHLLAWMPAGMVTVGIGDNKWAGGMNGSSFDLAGHIPGSTVRVDGRAIVDEGVLKP